MEKPAPKVETPTFYSGSSGRIVTPAGPPPCNPQNIENPTDSDLVAWVQEVIDKGAERRLDYAPEAVLYFSQRFWPSGTEVHKRLRAILFPAQE